MLMLSFPQQSFYISHVYYLDVDDKEEELQYSFELGMM